MARHVTACHGTLRHVAACHGMSSHVTACHVTSRHVTARYVKSRHVTSCHVTSRHVTARYVMSLYVTSRHVANGTSYHGTLRHGTLRHVTAPLPLSVRFTVATTQRPRVIQSFLIGTAKSKHYRSPGFNAALVLRRPPQTATSSMATTSH